MIPADRHVRKITLLMDIMSYLADVRKRRKPESQERHMSEFTIQGIVCAMLSGGMGFMLAMVVHILANSFGRSTR